MLFSLLASVLVLVSCGGETAESLIANRKDDVKKKFDQFYACYEIAKNTPPVTENKIEWETEDANLEYRTQNVTHIGMESFKDLSQPLDIPYDGMRRREHADMANLFSVDLSAHKEPHQYEIDPKYSYHHVESGDACKYAILHFLDTKYLVITKIHDIYQAMATGAETFNKGLVTGEALVFDVEKTKLLGGYTFEAKSDDIVNLGSGGGDVDANIKADLEANIQEAISNGFSALTPWVERYGITLS